MKLSERIHLVASGSLGLGLSDDYDCNVYLLDGGDERALIDAGAGLDARRIVELVRADGIEPRSITHLLLTHAHGDHAGGAAALRDELGPLRVGASPHAAAILATGDERAASLDVAKRAGIYPADYRFRPVPVDMELSPGRRVTVGALAIDVIATPGHCAGHLSFVVRRAGRVVLFAGDAVFPGGRIQLQPIHDCSISETIATLRALREVKPDELYAGHGAPVCDDAAAHVEQANEALDRLKLPPQMAP